MNLGWMVMGSEEEGEEEGRRKQAESIIQHIFFRHVSLGQHTHTHTHTHTHEVIRSIRVFVHASSNIKSASKNVSDL